MILNYALTQRLRMIDFLLANFDYASRRHLMDYFGLSAPQSSLDFRTYDELHPGNMRYDVTEKCWLVTPTFKRAYP